MFRGKLSPLITQYHGFEGDARGRPVVFFGASQNEK